MVAWWQKGHENGLVFLGIFWVSALVMLGALSFQYIGGYDPCSLCITQRWAHLALMLVALLAYFLPGRQVQTGWRLRITAIFALISAGIAFYHVGVEQGILTGPSGCSAPDISEMSLEQQVQALLQTAIVRCDEVVWSFLGLSMAAYNGLISLGLALLSFMMSFQRKG